MKLEPTLTTDQEHEEMEVEGGTPDATTQEPTSTYDPETREIEVEGSVVYTIRKITNISH